jgi:hypothetical protein
MIWKIWMKCEMIWKIWKKLLNDMENTEENSEKIWKL